jgi:hypothetical protein
MALCQCLGKQHWVSHNNGQYDIGIIGAKPIPGMTLGLMAAGRRLLLEFSRAILFPITANTT